MPRSLRLVVSSAAVAIALASLPGTAGAQVTSTGEHIQYALVTARDYIFAAPPTITAGIITFHLVNEGSDVHQLSIMEVGPGHTIKEFYDAMRVKGAPPPWTTTVGMTPTIQPNSETFLTLRLAPGRYVLSCMIPAKDGRSHVEKGMYQWVTIAPKAKPAAATAPATKKP
jgi:hypothetical protein